MLYKLLKLQQTKLEQNRSELAVVNKAIDDEKNKKEMIIKNSYMDLNKTGQIFDFELMRTNRLYIELEVKKIDEKIVQLQQELIKLNTLRKDIYIEVEKYNELIKEDIKIKKREDMKKAEDEISEFIQRKRVM